MRVPLKINQTTAIGASPKMSDIGRVQPQKIVRFTPNDRIKRLALPPGKSNGDGAILMHLSTHLTWRVWGSPFFGTRDLFLYHTHNGVWRMAQWSCYKYSI